MAEKAWIGHSERLMGQHAISSHHRFFGWAAIVGMAVNAVLMFATSF